MRDPVLIEAGRAPAPSAWVERFIGLAPKGGQILDVACGRGRHLVLGRTLGYGMVGVDRDLSGLQPDALGADTEVIAADLEDGSPWPFPGRRFGGVIVTNYLWRPLLASIVAAVAADGVLIYETFAIGNERLGRPRNPDFLLRPGELIDIVRPQLTVMAYEHVRLPGPDRIVQRIAAVGCDHALARDLGVA